MEQGAANIVENEVNLEEMMMRTIQLAARAMEKMGAKT